MVRNVLDLGKAHNRMQRRTALLFINKFIRKVSDVKTKKSFGIVYFWNGG